MEIFRVWAPKPKKVELCVDAKLFGMNHEADGWWSAVIEWARPGSRYGFLVDGEGPFPDPRSRFQPEGVHAPSMLLDPNAFAWTDASYQPPPFSTAIFYELHVGTFTPEGTFDAAISKLDHLVDVGITHIELMPVNAFPGEFGWGYDGVGLFAVHAPYGGPTGLKRFVDACHARKMAVVLDVVYNHLGPSGNYLGKFGPYFNPCYQTPWGPALNFSGPHSDQVRRFFCDNALMWLQDFHLDGLRLDAVHAIVDTSAMHFLEELREEVDNLSRRRGSPLILIAESDLNNPRLLRSVERGGFGLQAQWSDDFHHALHSWLTGETLGYYEDFGEVKDLAKALTNGFVYDGQFSKHRRRRHGRRPEGLSGHCFLGYLQNHDQVGNRATGQRLAQLLNTPRLKLGAALLFTSPFIPLVFMGEEWAASSPFLYFADHQEPGLSKAVREGRLSEFAAFGWRPEEIPDPVSRSTFEKSKLNWKELEQAKHSAMHDWYRQLIRLRREQPELTDGRLDGVKTHFDNTGQWIAVERGGLTTVCNLALTARTISIRPGKHQLLLASQTIQPPANGSITLPGEAVAILKTD